jgi:hypothetical protein
MAGIPDDGTRNANDYAAMHEEAMESADETAEELGVQFPDADEAEENETTEVEAE